MDLSELISEVKKHEIRFLVVCGGVASGIGKGITISSIASNLKKCNLRVSLIKIDPYLVIQTIYLFSISNRNIF